MKRFGGALAGGIESSRVVEVPRDRMAAPDADSETTVAGLSPVKGATMQPVESLSHDEYITLTWRTHLD